MIIIPQKQRRLFKYTGKTNPNDYSEQSKEKVREVLKFIQKYQWEAMALISQKPPDYERKLDDLQNNTKQLLSRTLTPDQLLEFSEGKDVSKMGFSAFMLKIIPKYMARFNILAIALNVLTAKEKSRYDLCLFFLKIDDVKPIDLSAEDHWGQSLATHTIQVGQEILINEKRMAPVNPLTDMGLTRYGNILFFNDTVTKETQQLLDVNVKNTLIDMLGKYPPLKQVISRTRTPIAISEAKSNAKMVALNYALAKMTVDLFAQPSE